MYRILRREQLQSPTQPLPQPLSAPIDALSTETQTASRLEPKATTTLLLDATRNSEGDHNNDPDSDSEEDQDMPGLSQVSDPESDGEA